MCFVHRFFHRQSTHAKQPVHITSGLVSRHFFSLRYPCSGPLFSQHEGVYFDHQLFLYYSLIIMNKNLLRKLEGAAAPRRDMINQYKRQDVFRCTHESHRHFNSAVSVYHVLKEKKCFPDGCIYFKWRCRRLDKGHACPRKYKHVGRGCASCKDYYDIKVIKKPEIVLSPEAYARFQEELMLFERWLKATVGSMVEFSGVVNSVKPRYSLHRTGKRHRITFDGFLLNFSEGFAGTTHFADFIYAPVSSRMQGRHRFAKGDHISMQCYFTMQEGTPVLRKPRSIEVLQRGCRPFWNESRARVAQRTGTVLPYQDEKCYSCERGVLLTVENDDNARSVKKRKMFCLEGIESPELCCYAAHRELHDSDTAG